MKFETQPLAARLRRLAQALRWVFGPAALAFFVFAALGSREILATLLDGADLGPLLAAAFLWALLHLLSPLFAWIALRDLGATLNYRTALAIHVARLPARYLPGGIWHTVTRVMDLSRHGVGSTALSIMVILENVLPVGMAASLGGLAIASASPHRTAGLICTAAGALLLGGASLASRYRLARGLPGVRPIVMVRLMAVMALFWLGASSAFACYWSAFPARGGGAGVLEIYGAYLLSWAAGFVTVFAPQGVGVFEGIVAWLLQGSLPFAGVVVLAAGFRVIVLLADLLAQGLFLLIRIERRLQRGNLH
jgi:hypothetical protein